MSKSKFRVIAPLDMASGLQGGTVVIDRETGIFSVRPYKRRKVFELPLGAVATVFAEPRLNRQ